MDKKSSKRFVLNVVRNVTSRLNRRRDVLLNVTVVSRGAVGAMEEIGVLDEILMLFVLNVEGQRQCHSSRFVGTPFFVETVLIKRLLNCFRLTE